MLLFTFAKGYGGFQLSTVAAEKAPFDEFDKVETLLSSLEGLVAGIRGTAAIIPSELDQQMKAMIRLSRLTLFHFRETVKCLAGSAFFAANIVGAAGLESLLLLLCLMREKEIVQTAAWNNICQGKSKTFLKTLGRMDLAKLIEIARETNWFPTGGIGGWPR